MPGYFFVADLRKEAFPSFLETTFAEIKSITPRKNTNTQPSVRVNGKAVDTRPAVVQVIALFRRMDRAVEPLAKVLPFGHPLGVLKVQPDDFLGCEPKSERIRQASIRGLIMASNRNSRPRSSSTYRFISQISCLFTVTTMVLSFRGGHGP